MIISAPEFRLKETLSSGQLFRYHLKKDGTAVVFHRDNAFSLRQEGDKIHMDGARRAFVTRFLGLDHELAPILSEVNKDEHLDTAITTYHGLRIMRQDPWECLIDFVCSSCASIPKITLNLKELSKKFGDSLEHEGVKGHTFPAPGSLNSLAKIKAAKTGFRSRFLLGLNTIDEDELKGLSKLPYAEAKNWLMQHDGIGEKVADCILLFSHGFYEAFPVDTWIQKGIQELYFKGKETPTKEIRRFGQEYFGRYAGYAQQYLFHWKRMQTREHL